MNGVQGRIRAGSAPDCPWLRSAMIGGAGGGNASPDTSHPTGSSRGDRATCIDARLPIARRASAGTVRANSRGHGKRRSAVGATHAGEARLSPCHVVPLVRSPTHWRDGDACVDHRSKRQGLEPDPRPGMISSSWRCARRVSAHASWQCASRTGRANASRNAQCIGCGRHTRCEAVSISAVPQRAKASPMPWFSGSRGFSPVWSNETSRGAICVSTTAGVRSSTVPVQPPPSALLSAT